MRFPVFALIATIVTSLVLWVVTKSPYTLLFALMGPVMAVASYGDGRLGERRRAKKDAAQAQAEELIVATARRQEGEWVRKALREAHPAPGYLSALDPRARPPWNPDLTAAGTVRLGVASENDASDVSDVKNCVPLLVQADFGIVCVGNPLFSLALARALWMQLAWNVAPETLSRHPSGCDRDVLASSGAWPVRLVAAEADIPPAARFVVEILSPNEGRLSDRDNPGAGVQIFIPDYITAVEASTFALRLGHVARQIEQARPGAELPTQCALSELLTLPPAAEDFEQAIIARTSLLANVGVAAAGIFSLDLVTNGPHAVVTGMTGSGKTEFLLSWLLSMGLRYSPQEFTVLVIDFKGGSGFASLECLPHCLGVLTDLDVDAAQRALKSLGAEIRFRERTLNEARVTDFAALPDKAPLARLALVVDEYRALLDRFPELQPLFLDIAARGRALGIHLILGTQRATGVLADGILANCALRIVFRVNNVNDSMALLETDAARTLPEIPGRAALIGTALALTHVQIAWASSADAVFVEQHARHWLAAHPLFLQRRPWLPPLPPSISLAELSALGGATQTRSSPGPSTALADHPLLLGLLDEPEEQRQSVIAYSPRRDGHLLVSGGQGSGRTNALNLLASQESRALYLGAHDAEGAWDAITGADGDDSLMVIDDIEALLAQFTLEHRDAFLDALVAVLRTGPGRGTFVVIASQAGPLFAATWVALLKSTLTLGPVAGRGLWQGQAVQVAQAVPGVQGGGSRPTALSPADAPPIQWRSGQSYVVVTPRPRSRMAQFLASALRPRSDAVSDAPAHFTDVGRREIGSLEVFDGETAHVFVGDVEDWQAQYALLAQLRARATFIFDDCSPAEVRAIRRSREVLPHARRGTALGVFPDGTVSRVGFR